MTNLRKCRFARRVRSIGPMDDAKTKNQKHNVRILDVCKSSSHVQKWIDGSHSKELKLVPGGELISSLIASQKPASNVGVIESFRTEALPGDAMSDRLITLIVDGGVPRR